jgi:hypothetical protein
MAFIPDVSKGRIKSGYVEGEAFDKALKTLKQNAHRIITIPEYAELRMQEGKNSFCSQNGARVSEWIVYIPKDNCFYWIKDPVLNKLAKDATNAHRNNQEFFPNKNILEELLETAIKVPFDYANKRIPANKLHNDRVFSQIYEKIAKKYGSWLFDKENGIQVLTTGFCNILDKDYIKNQNKPFAIKVWFLGLGDASGLYSDDRSLDGSGYRVRGVREDASWSEPRKTSEAGSQKNLIYSPSDLNILRKVRKGNLAPKALERILKRLGE